jgi:hypothetical protein
VVQSTSSTAPGLQIWRAGHLADRDVVFLADGRHSRVGGTADVVGHVVAGVQRGLGDLGVARLGRPDGVAAGRLRSLDRRVEPVEFLVRREHVESLVRGLQADIDDVGTLGGQFLVDVLGGLLESS